MREVVCITISVSALCVLDNEVEAARSESSIGVAIVDVALTAADVFKVVEVEFLELCMEVVHEDDEKIEEDEVVEVRVFCKFVTATATAERASVL